jgi:hypothetical protein
MSLASYPQIAETTSFVGFICSCKSRAWREPKFQKKVPWGREGINHGRNPMRDPEEFRMYAEECRRLALTLPQHREALLQMAEAWKACAEEAEKHRDKDNEHANC